MLTVYNYLLIRTAHAQGESIRSLSRRLHRAQKTLRKVIASATGEPERYTRAGPVIYPKLGKCIAFIEQILQDDQTAPEHAILLSCDEKSQIQALDRTQPGLPLKKGRCGTMTHDYKRNGITSLFAAMNVADGTIISDCHPRHRHQEWLKFLKLIKSQVPPDKTVHLICDNYATHKHPKVQAWAQRNPRFIFHFTPTGASWLNMIERFFRDLTDKAIRRGSFYNVEDLVGAIMEYVNAHNQNPKPFIWTATAKDILAKVKRARRAQLRAG